jgi:signal transduction histidine kinase
MIEELLDVSRISAGNMRLQLGEVRVAPAIDAALEAVRPAAEARGVELSKHLEATSRTLRADPQRLQQILWNLLSNAVRFTPRGGHVSVETRDLGAELEIAVVDTGSGIPPSFLPHVFERFRQGDSSTTRAHGGLGLGLAIVRDLVELHGGSVDVDSDGDDRGTTFKVRLPWSRATGNDFPRTERDEDTPALAGRRVLIVDDDPDSRDVVRTISNGPARRL